MSEEQAYSLLKSYNETLTKKKRLKKDCPCRKCVVWREERAMKKLNKQFKDALANSSKLWVQVTSCPPITPDMPVSIGRKTSEPNQQTIPRDSFVFIGGKK